MINRFGRRLQLLSVFLIISICATSVCAQGNQAKPLTEAEAKKAEKLRKKEDARRIEARTSNGIFVDNPKVYDDSSLQLMLNSARARLATIQAIDQTGLLSRIGAVTGASLNQSSLGITVSGPSIPGSVVTNNAPTGSTVLNSANGGSTVTTTNLPVQGAVTTNPQQNPTIPTAPAGGVALPTSGFSVSALDALSEQMQLTYEIANLQLLLEGSLSDRYVKDSRLVKPRTTLGFPITITSLPQYKNAVAIVEVQVTNAERNFERTATSKDRPAVTALLPREKTYNVAALTDKMTSIGGGLVTQVINGGFSYFRGRKSYYIVQDQDTLANLIAPDPGSPHTTAFSWEFRPVLGQSFVKGGLKQTFVQLSAPLEAAANCFGQIKVRTYWRRVDRKTGVLKEVIPESISDVGHIDPDIPIFDITPLVEEVAYDDLGNGQVRVSVVGNFLGGTYIRVGGSSYREGSPGFVSELRRIQFVAPAADVAKHKAFIVSRAGTETEVIQPLGGPSPASRVETCKSTPEVVVQVMAAGASPAPKPTPTLTNVAVTSFDDTRSVVTATLTNGPGIGANEYLMIVNDRVFGLADAPIQRDASKNTYRAVVPTSLVSGPTTVKLKPLFWHEDYAAASAAVATTLESIVDKVVVFDRSGDPVKFLLYGSRLSASVIVVPTGITLSPLGQNPPTDIGTFTLTKAQWAATKQIVLQKSTQERPVFVTLPSSDPPPKLALTIGSRVFVGTNDLTVTGDVFDNLKSVTYNKTPITKALDGKALKLSGLVAAGVTAIAGEPELQFEFEDGRKNSLKFDVISTKVEIVPKP